MSDYSIQVYLQKLTCRDTESIHSSDRFALTGAVTTDQQTTGLMEPTFRINDTRFADVHDYGGRLIFDGMATTPRSPSCCRLGISTTTASGSRTKTRSARARWPSPPP